MPAISNAATESAHHQPSAASSSKLARVAAGQHRASEAEHAVTAQAGDCSVRRQGGASRGPARATRWKPRLSGRCRRVTIPDRAVCQSADWARCQVETNAGHHDADRYGGPALNGMGVPARALVVPEDVTRTRIASATRRAVTSSGGRRTRSTWSAPSRSPLEEVAALEVNACLRGEHVRDAVRAGLHVVCSTDAHSVRGLTGRHGVLVGHGAPRLDLAGVLANR